MSDTVRERRALGIVNALTEQDTASCSDCGAEVDVSEATTAGEVVAVLESHREEHSENAGKRTEER